MQVWDTFLQSALAPGSATGLPSFASERCTRLHSDCSSPQAVEVVKDKSGAGLVKLVEVTISQEEFLAWFISSEVSRHFSRFYWCTHNVQLSSMPDRAMVCSTARSTCCSAAFSGTQISVVVLKQLV